MGGRKICVSWTELVSFSHYHPWWLSRESTCQWRRCGFNLWVGKIPGEGSGNPLQYSCLVNPMDREAWQAVVHGGHRRVGHNIATEQQQPLLVTNSNLPEWLDCSWDNVAKCLSTPVTNNIFSVCGWVEKKSWIWLLLWLCKNQRVGD